MCRFLAYSGPRISLHEMLYEPEHSLIHQSVHAYEREEPLNGDGWGVGWYDHRVTEQPGLYRSLSPAWSDENMRHTSPLVETPLFMAHVRAASPGLPVQQLNCHPFRGGVHEHASLADVSEVERGRRQLLFMHNGGLAGFKRFKRHLQSRLSEEAYHGIQGSTDSEHLVALAQDALGQDVVDPTARDLADAIETGLSTVTDLQREHGGLDEETSVNACLTDGDRLAVVRHAHGEDASAPSLYVGRAGGFHCEAEDRLRATDPGGEGAVLVASERLWRDERVWSEVPRGHVAMIDPDGGLETAEIDLGT
jgi:predicted glutamine amidotransferase